MHGIPAQPATDFPPIVLLVEDDPDTRAMYELVLSQDGLWATGASNTREALDIAHELHPDVIVTDIGVPGDRDVVSMVRALRDDAKTRHVPVIAVTGRQIGRTGGGTRGLRTCWSSPSYQRS